LKKLPNGMTSQSFVEKIPLYLELSYLLVQSGNKGGFVILFLGLVATEYTNGALNQRVLPFANLAGVYLKTIGQLSYRFFTFQCFELPSL
jgi:hypothetical protein